MDTSTAIHAGELIKELAEAEGAVIRIKRELAKLLGIGPEISTPAPSRTPAPQKRTTPGRPPANELSPTRPSPVEKLAASGSWAPWTTVAAKALVLRMKDADVRVLRYVIGEGGSVRVDKIPRLDGKGFIQATAIYPSLTAVRTASADAGYAPPIGVSGENVVVEPGFLVAYRAWMEPGEESRPLLRAVDASA